MDNTIPTPELNLQTRSAEVPIDSTPASTGANPAQNYAKGLMDELFGDLDGLLDGTLVPPSEPLKVEEPKAKAPINLDFATFLSTHPSITASPSLAASLASGRQPELLSIPQDEPIELPPMSESGGQEARSTGSYGFLEKALIMVGCSSAAVAVLIMLASQGVLGRVWMALKSGSVSPVASAPANPNDVKFADYMGKTLDSIDGKLKSNQPGANLPSIGLGLRSSVSLPTVKVPGNPSNPGSPSGSTLVIGGVPNAPATTPLMGAAPANGAMNPVQNELNQAVSKLSGLVDRMTNGGSTNGAVGRSPLSSVTVAPGMTTAARAPQVAPVNAAPAPQRTLKAVMELGAQSVVLFEMNGVSQRYEKGENIGNSGWVVVKIENGSAIVRRNGEVRTLSVGQKI
jgi:hypothetical protein